ncbi:hypothetical protein BC941DRAFT_510515 [Chlamydoabsidia padenii]|nr:hypothetical protein BC941DRAFT_510515 [Chlamydoabsidia padenii]
MGKESYNSVVAIAAWTCGMIFFYCANQATWILAIQAFGNSATDYLTQVDQHKNQNGHAVLTWFGPSP